MERINTVKTGIFSILGIVGGYLGHALGGWDILMATLAGFMAIDWVSGFIVAKIFSNSPKTESGKASSRAGFKGLCKKSMIVAMVYMAVRLDMVIGTDYLRSGVIVAFMVNESLSIVENVTLMGIDLPPVLIKGVEVLRQKGEDR